MSELKSDDYSYYSGWVRDLRVKLSELESEEHSLYSGCVRDLRGKMSELESQVAKSLANALAKSLTCSLSR